MSEKSGPLAGLRVVELAGLGPVPFAAMLLSDLGAEVIRIDRPPSAAGLDTGDPRAEILFRGRQSACVDLSVPAGVDVLRRLCANADVLLEGNRPGVAERLGIGPDECRKANPRLIYARATGWGQDGPLAARAGHDINYTALTGALGAIGEAGRKPVPALNVISDFGGGGSFLVIGVLAALVERDASGCGQVIDAAMVDGASYLLASVHTMVNSGQWRRDRGANIIDGGAPFYDTYMCADGEYVAVGALEPKFWRILVDTIGLEVDPQDQWDTSTWPALREQLTHTFLTRARDEWSAILEHVDACVTPVLSFEEVADHPHVAARRTMVDGAGGSQPAPAPRFSRTPGAIGNQPDHPGGSTRQVLASLGLSDSEIESLAAAGTVVLTERG